ncbi:MAG: site-2 protease family protein, partial [Pyrinomonadaceae bacterium]
MSESVQAATPFVEAPAPRSVGRRAARPTTREYVRHFALFLLTITTTTIGGLAFLGTSVPEPPLPKLNSLFDYLIFIPELYIKTIASVVMYAFAHPAMLAEGLTFSVALLTILTAHEFGHYFTCRAYGVDATLPFFIPAPPLIGPGTFGAFIKIKSPIPSRRALFDIGVSGPLAGFAVAVPVAIVGLSSARVV